MQIISDWVECCASITSILASEKPAFIARIGGSDTNAVVAHLKLLRTPSPDNRVAVQSHLSIVERYNGYYDRASNLELYDLYLDTLLQSYARATDVFFCNYQLLSIYFAGNIHPSFLKSDFDGRDDFLELVNYISSKSPNCRAYPYNFAEKLVSHPLSLFNVFASTLVGKRVLVVSPFAKSIEKNFGNRSKFFKNYVYPEFELSICNTPITYAGLPERYYPHQNWFETTRALCAEISLLDFDIALLSCGSYAVPIGDHIKALLGKKAVYVGGILQLFFGIMGRRYSGNAFFEDQINSQYFISPVERETFLQHVDIKTDTAREAFGAYF